MEGVAGIEYQWASLVTEVAAHRRDRIEAGQQADRLDTVPVTVLTGFLGAGKSTILAGLLSDPGDAGIVRAVVNDVGRLPFDPALVDTTSSRSEGGRSTTVELTNGCGCCVAGAAAELGDRLDAVAVGADLVVLEASGLADPVALAQVVAARPGLRVERVVAVVDGRSVDRLLTVASVAPILRRQMDAGEAIILSHADGLAAEAANDIVERIGRLAQGAPVVPSTLADPAHRVLAPGFRIGARPGRGAGHGVSVPEAQSFDDPPPVTAEALRAALSDGSGLLRAKGRLIVDGAPTLVQRTPSGLTLTPDRPGPIGLTIVTADGTVPAAFAALLDRSAGDPAVPARRSAGRPLGGRRLGSVTEGPEAPGRQRGDTAMSLPLGPGEWTLDPAHSVVGFAVRHLGISTIRGRFTDVTATLGVSDSLATTTLQAEVAMASVSTGNEGRDGHLQSTDIFDVATQPKMHFVSTAIAEAGEGRFSVTGDMTINGTTRAETLDVEFFGSETNPMDGSVRAGFAATGSIDRTDYGIDWNVPMPGGGGMLATVISLSLDAQLIGPADDEAS